VLPPPDAQALAGVLASLAERRDELGADPRLADLLVDNGSAARRMSRVVAHAPLWGWGADRASVEALALALRDITATFESWTAPIGVDDEIVLAAALGALAQAPPLDAAADAPGLAVGLLGEALGVYHAAIDLGDVERVRETVRGHVARALGYVLWALDFKRT